MDNILDFDMEELKSWMNDNGESEFRAKQIMDWIYKNGQCNFDNMTNIPKKLLEKLKRNFYIGTTELVKKWWKL